MKFCFKKTVSIVISSSYYIYYLFVALIVIEIWKIMVKKKNPPKQPKHLVAADGAEQAQASVDIEELVCV